MAKTDRTRRKSKGPDGRVISIAQQKGGTGKTTLTVHLATAALERGKSVALVDLDPQASLTEWYHTRMDQGEPIRGRQHDDGADETLILRQCSSWRSAIEVDALKRDYDLVLLDNPPGAEASSKIAIRGADLLLIPVQLSPADLWAMQATLDLATREDTDVLLVCNRVPPRSRLADEVLDKIRAQRLPVAKAQLGNRVAYAAALMVGQGITEFARSSAAAHEIRSLDAELRRLLSPQRQKESPGVGRFRFSASEGHL
ncbi:MAG: ParA family partition ATPase [Pseudomonadota bacterium]